MERLLIYYNPNHNCFYNKISKLLTHEVGHINQFDHMLVQVLAYDYKIKDLVNVEKKTTYAPIMTKKNKLINRVIGFLDKLKDK